MQVEELEGRVVPSYFPSTADGIHVIEDQLPSSLSAAMTRFVATHTDGTQKELLNQTNQFRAINPDFTVLHYQLGTGNSPYDFILNDQWSSDWNYVNQQESWFAHQTYSGEPQSAADLASGRVGNSTGWDQADVANPAWQQYTLGQVFQNMAATGSNAWFADSFTYGIGGGGYDGTVPTRYQGTNAANPADWPGGVTWTTQLGNWARVVENAFAQHNATYGTDYKFIPNLDARATSWEPNWYDDANGVPVLDGAFLEGFGQYTDTYNWTLSLGRGLDLTRNGKIVIMQPYPSAAPNTAAGQQQVDFFLGTYLLLKGDQTYLNIDYGGGVQYYPEYQLDLGAATTPLPGDVSGYLWNGVYRRDFQNGFVLVNPGTTTHTLNLGGTYRQVHASGGGTMSDAQLDANGNYTGGSLTYQNVNSVTLAGGSAAIFLDPSNSATFLKTDTATQGYWQGAYGGNGYNVIDGGAPSYPSYATVTPSGSGDYVWAASTPDPRALQKPANPVDHVAAMWYSATSFTVDVNLTDGQAHQVALYLLDWDGGGGRSERIDVIDATSGAVLDSETASGFGSGEYLVWSLSGHVEFRVTRLAGPNAVLSGLFFGPAGTPPSGTGSASFLKSDGTTQGSWQNTYGGDGYNVVAAGTPSYPAYASVTPVGPASYVWAASTPDVRALQKPASPSDRIAAAWYAAGGFTVDVNLTDGQTHQVALYLLDFDGGGRSERVDVVDAVSGKLLDSRTAAGFGGGDYLVWTLGGHVQLRVTGLSGPNAVLSGLFFGPGKPPAGGGSASFLKSDSATQGYWQGAYGGDGYNVIDGGAPAYPSYATVTPSGNGDYVWQASTIDPRALQKPASPADHVAAMWYSTTSFTVDVNLTDGKTHPVALYLLDWDGGNGRSERIDVLDAGTGAVLDSETASAFGSGEYLVWALGGHVTFRVTRLAGPNAALSGLFFGPAGAPPSGTGSATFVKVDAATQGSWQNAYGNDGFNVIGGGAPSYPAYATVTPTGNADYVWAASTSDPRGLQKPAAPSDRVAAAWYSATTFTVNMNLTGGTHQVALYLLDFDGGNRSEQIDVLDATTGKVLSSQTASNFGGGEYLVWDLGGNVLVRVTRLAGPNAVLSGLFFDPTV